MLDMLIQGGRVVTPAGVGNWDVGIIGEQIVAVAFPGILPGMAKQVINASGKIVVPGGIETHAHAVANVQPESAKPLSPIPAPNKLLPVSVLETSINSCRSPERRSRRAATRC